MLDSKMHTVATEPRAVLRPLGCVLVVFKVYNLQQEEFQCFLAHFNYQIDVGNTNETTRIRREISFRITTGNELKSATSDFNNRYLFRIVVLPEGENTGNSHDEKQPYQNTLGFKNILKMFAFLFTSYQKCRVGNSKPWVSQ